MRTEHGLLAISGQYVSTPYPQSWKSSFAMLRAAETFWEISRICKTL